MLVENCVATPDVVGRRSTDVKLTYDISGAKRARDRVVFKGDIVGDPLAFPVTGTTSFPQSRSRQVTVSLGDADSAEIVVMVQELTEADVPVGGEMRCSTRLRVKKA